MMDLVHIMGGVCTSPKTDWFLACRIAPHSPTAQTGHMGALHKIGQMYSQGISAGKSCTTALHAFKGKTRLV